MTLIADIVATVTATPAPVLFLDTCILIDVVRAPIRNKASEVEFGRLFLACAQKNPKTIHLLVPSPVQTEWNKNIASGVNDCTTGLTACNAVSSICVLLALPAVAVLPAAVLNMPTLLHQLSSDLLAACTTIDHHAAALSRAVDRIVANTHPVKDNSKGAKDSVILEHAVETTFELRNAGFGGTCLFVSSNTKDFAAPGSTNLHPQLTAAFNPVNLQYAVSLADGVAILTAAGWVP